MNALLSSLNTAQPIEGPLAAIVELAIGRLERGLPLDVEAFAAAHPEYASQLRELLPTVATMVRLGSMTAEWDPSKEFVDSHINDTSGSSRLEVRCPNCHQPTRIAADTTLTDLTCSSCGSHFSLVDHAAATEMAPPLTTLGRFELIERLGVGGFGSVWKARDKELDRTVAIKIPRADRMTADEQEKFFREARAAAQLRHSNIVSVHEVGRDGQSVYIVSDFVRGVTLGDWLTGQQPTGREAAELCAKIAEALHHAHEQGVIHRDLKPANIIIDCDGQPHLMDFGLARREVGEVTVTVDGQVLGTPAYMSPEQALGEAHTADRRSDVYSLGVILFQLLTGELPFRGNARMLLHQVVNDEPPSPRKLNGSIKRDLETITLKCLEKSPDRRYQSAHELADELRRYLRGEAIHARPVGRVEHAVRWVRRNRIVSALAALVVVALLSGTIVSLYFAIRSERNAQLAIERENEAVAAKKDAVSREQESAAVTKFLVDAFKSPDPNRKGRTVTVAEVLDGAEKKVEQLSDQPLIQAALWQAIGDVRPGLGLYTEGVEPLRKAYEIRLRERGSEHADTLLSKASLADALFRLNRRGEAEKIYEELVAIRRKNAGSKDRMTLATISTLSYIYILNGRYDDAIQLANEVYLGRREIYGPEHIQTMNAASRLGAAYTHKKQFNKAIELQAMELAARRKANKTGEPLDAGSLAATCYYAARYQQAIDLFLETIAAREKKMGRDHPDTLNAINMLSACYLRIDRAAEAIPLLEEIVEVNRKKFGEGDRSTINYRMNLGKAYRAAGQTDAAIRDYEAALTGARTSYGLASQDAIDLTGSLIELYPDQERTNKAISECEAGLVDLQKKFGSESELVQKTQKAIQKLRDAASKRRNANAGPLKRIKDKE